MSNMSEMDARINEAIERVGDITPLYITCHAHQLPITTFYEDESKTVHADGSVTYAYPIGEMYPDAPSWAMFVGYTYRDGLLLAGPTFAEFRSDFMEWGRWA